MLVASLRGVDAMAARAIFEIPHYNLGLLAATAGVRLSPPSRFIAYRVCERGSYERERYGLICSECNASRKEKHRQSDLFLLPRTVLVGVPEHEKHRSETSLAC